MTNKLRNFARNIGKKAAFVVLIALFIAANANAADSHKAEADKGLIPSANSGEPPRGEKETLPGAPSHTDDMRHSDPLEPPKKAFAAVGLALGFVKKRMYDGNDAADELSPEDLDAADKIAGDWADIFLPYLSDVTPEAAKDNAFDIIAVGMAERQRLEHDLETIKEDRLADTYR